MSRRTSVKHPGKDFGVHVSADRDERGHPCGTTSFAGAASPGAEAKLPKTNEESHRQFGWQSK